MVGTLPSIKLQEKTTIIKSFFFSYYCYEINKVQLIRDSCLQHIQDGGHGLSVSPASSWTTADIQGHGRV